MRFNTEDIIQPVLEFKDALSAVVRNYRALEVDQRVNSSCDSSGLNAVSF